MVHGDITRIDTPVGDKTRAKELYSRLFGWNTAAPPGLGDYPCGRPRTRATALLIGS